MLTKRLKNKDDYIIPNQVPQDIPHGDMPRDIIVITDKHIEKTNTIFPKLLQCMEEKEMLEKNEKIVISIFGGAGVGKSEIASVLSYYFAQNGLNCYILSGDNYNQRVPQYNFAERTRIFRSAGVFGLLENNLYNAKVQEILDKLWAATTDFDVDLNDTYPFLSTYQKYGRASLTEYLGSATEMEYSYLNKVLKAFKEKENKIYLKRMNNGADEIWYEEVDFSNIDIMFIEWVHGSHELLEGVDMWFMLDSTPEETVAHRRLRKREKEVDSHWAKEILGIEDMQLRLGVKKAAFIVTKDGEIINYTQYKENRTAKGYSD